jgi:hypothetical protein
MKESECVLGAKVICVLQGSPHYARIGSIGQIDRVNDKIVIYHVLDIYNSFTHNIGVGWSDLNSWNVIDPNLLGDKKVKILSKECPCGIARADCDYHR